MDSFIDSGVKIISNLDNIPAPELITSGIKIVSRLHEERLKNNLKILIENIEECLGEKGNIVFERLGRNEKKEINRLMIVLNDIDEEVKVYILSKLLVAYLNSQINSIELSEYVEIVRRSFFNDLKYFVENAPRKEFEEINETKDGIEYVNAPFPKDSVIALRLSSFSLVVPVHSMRYGDLGLLAYYKVTEYGYKMHTIIAN